MGDKTDTYHNTRKKEAKAGEPIKSKMPEMVIGGRR
jgi:hypothetical protein